MTLVSTTTFHERALEALPGGPASIAAQRRTALDLFRTMPLPSQETEEWRYTDLSDFELDFAAYTPGRAVTSLADVPGELMREAGSVKERAGLLIQHNSTTTIAHLDPEIRGANEDADPKATVHFESIDAALADHPEIVHPYLHALVPADRTKFTALHSAFRTGGTFVLVPRNTAIELPIQAVTRLDVDGAAIFPHTLLVVEPGAEVTFIDRYVSPDQTRGFSDAIVEIFVRDRARATGALGNVLAGHLQVDATGVRAFGRVHGEERLDLLQDSFERPGLVATGRRNRVAVHWIA